MVTFMVAALMAMSMVLRLTMMRADPVLLMVLLLCAVTVVMLVMVGIMFQRLLLLDVRVCLRFLLGFPDDCLC